jgi:hypothetical protein
MAEVETYRRYARECMQLAETASPEQRVLLVEMARTWHQLAQEREREEAARSREQAERSRSRRTGR